MRSLSSGGWIFWRCLSYESGSSGCSSLEDGSLLEVDLLRTRLLVLRGVPLFSDSVLERELSSGFLFLKIGSCVWSRGCS